ncbi:MAG: hypothetical protein H6Q18_120 [Bacteroidetes bacterium]|nr:hypothetical protein [Bacteroidota bacterium]
MNKTGFFQNIKVIVFIGYIFLFLLAVLGVYQIFQQMVKFSKEKPLSERKQLNLISNALVALYETETMRKVMISDNFDYNTLHSNYNKSNSKTHIYLDSLYQCCTERTLHLSLDTINVLLSEKENNMNSMLLLLDSINKLPYTKKSLTTVLSKKEISNLDDIFKKKLSKQTSDSSYYVSQKKGFFKKLKEAFSDNEDSTKIITKQNIQTSDSIYHTPFNRLTDTIVQYINDVSYKSGKKKAIFIAKLSLRQSKMYYYDELLTNQIREILHKLELKERENESTLILDREKTIRKSSHYVSLIALVSLFTLVFFILLTLNLINKSQIFRNKLEESKLYAEDLLNSRERLLLMISHDIKAPLSSIIGHLELLSKEKMPEKEKLHVDNMRNSSEHILELVNKLMDYHKLEQGKSEINMMVFSPQRLMEDIFNGFIPIATKKSLLYTSQNNIDSHEVFESDPFIIKQIVNNLITNAIKFTKKGEVLLTSSLNNDAILLISVKDSGIGIKPEDKDRIFEEFKRVGNVQERQNVDGFGLGLAITYKLVELLGGDIKVNSEFGKGSEFTVMIPLKRTNKTITETPSSSNIPQKRAANISLKVLFVDDDLAMLNVYKKLLQLEGADVMLCSNSKEVISLLGKAKFDIILTDIQMPQMNGFELIQKIRELKSDYFQKLPVIAMSARSDLSEDVFKAAGFTAFLIKPVPFNVLLEKIYHIVENQAIVSNDKDMTIKQNTKGIYSLIEFVEDDKETAIDILNVFVSENKLKIAELKDSLLTNNREQIKNTAHKLLPLMRMIGADRIVEIALHLEKGETKPEEVNELCSLLEEKNEEIGSFIKEKYQ